MNMNQLGYRRQDKKVCIAVAPREETLRFEVLDAHTHAVVYTGKGTDPIDDADSGERVVQLDFSALSQDGEYVVRLANGEESAPFPISMHPYRAIKTALLKSFYFQRCGIELEETYASVWKHEPCHLEDGWLPEEQQRQHSACGGWHDAGDYGKYTVPAAKAVADLLLAYECYPDGFTDDIGIPESGNGWPDVLDEVKYELDWLLRMQRNEDGAVYHKLTTLQFPPLDTMPEDDLGELHFAPVSTAAAGTFAACMAMAGRVFQEWDASYAAICLDAAKRAWQWLESHPEDVPFVNPASIVTGEYGDRIVRDERYWAAAELYRTTGEAHYHEAFKRLWAQGEFLLYELGWADVGGYGTLAYLMLDPDAADPKLRNELHAGWIEKANEYVRLAEASGYRVAMATEDYIWGSSMVWMNRAMHLILAAHMSGEGHYRSVALDQWHYLLGQNPLQLCYVTGFGQESVKHPHHRPSVGDGVDEPVPGMVAGGPNKNLQDLVSVTELTGRPPANCFVDDQESYATNEMTIYWNSPAVFVAACFDQ